MKNPKKELKKAEAKSINLASWYKEKIQLASLAYERYWRKYPKTSSFLGIPKAYRGEDYGDKLVAYKNAATEEERLKGLYNEALDECCRLESEQRIYELYSKSSEKELLARILVRLETPLPPSKWYQPSKSSDDFDYLT